MSVVQHLSRRAAVIERVSPLAVRGIERKGSIGAAQRGRRLKFVLAKIYIIDNQSATGSGVARGAVGDAACLGHRIVARADRCDRRTIIRARDIDLDRGFAERAVAEADRVNKLIREHLASGERINVATLPWYAATVGDPIFDIAVIDPHPIAAKGALPRRDSRGIHVFDEKIEVCGQRVAIAILDREQALRISPKVVCHDIEKKGAGGDIVERRIGSKNVLQVGEAVVFRLRRVCE